MPPYTTKKKQRTRKTEQLPSDKAKKGSIYLSLPATQRTGPKHNFKLLDSLPVVNQFLVRLRLTF